MFIDTETCHIFPFEYRWYHKSVTLVRFKLHFDILTFGVKQRLHLSIEHSAFVNFSNEFCRKAMLLHDIIVAASATYSSSLY